MTLIRRDGVAQNVQVVEISGSAIVHLASQGGAATGSGADSPSWVTHKVAECIALLANDAASTSIHGGMLELTDGQRLPGSVLPDEPGTGTEVELAEPSTPRDRLAWEHAWLGRIEVPLDRISQVLLQVASASETDETLQSKSDVIVLTNGDVIEGFVTGLGNPVTLEVEVDARTTELELPLDRVAAVRIVAPVQPASGWRVWFRDGTVLDVASLHVGDDGFMRLRFGEGHVGAQRLGPPPEKMKKLHEDVAAIVFAPQAMVPLASLAPKGVSGPAYRYVIPPPRTLDGDAGPAARRSAVERQWPAPSVEFRGPMVAHYELPPESSRFVCDAILPESSRTWGDVQLIVRCDGEEVGRFEINAASPVASINAPLPGSELTIELAEGRNGPIQDLLVLRNPMILRRGG